MFVSRLHETVALCIVFWNAKAFVNGSRYHMRAQALACYRELAAACTRVDRAGAIRAAGMQLGADARISYVGACHAFNDV